MRSITNSQTLFEKAVRIIPAGTQTFSKGPSQYVQGVAPIYLERGLGSHVWDVDGNEYIDYVMGLGPVTLGYCHPAVNAAIKKQLEKGISFTLMHPLEVELSEKLVSIIPCAEMVRFGKNGSDVTSAAVRVARAFTCKDKIACCGYHGWQDWYIGSTAMSRGVPGCVKELTLPFRYRDINRLQQIFSDNPGEVAAVIMEPVTVMEQDMSFLSEVKQLAHINGALLIFDEIVTGFRIALAGIQEYSGITPDLATFGKGMANGMPLSAIVGRREIMQLFDEVFFSFTFGGETLSLAAGLATIGELEKDGAMQNIADMGSELKNGYNKLAKENGLEKVTGCTGFPAYNGIWFKDDRGRELHIKSLFQQEMIKHGILTIGVHLLSQSHTGEDIRRTLEAYSETLQTIARALADGHISKFMEGKMLCPVLRKR